MAWTLYVCQCRCVYDQALWTYMRSYSIYKMWSFPALLLSPQEHFNPLELMQHRYLCKIRKHAWCVLVEAAKVFIRLCVNACI